MSSIRVLYDHQIFLAQHFGGISRYFTELINHSAKADIIETILPFNYSTNQYLWNAPVPWRRRGLHWEVRFPGRRRLETIVERWLSIEYTRHAITRGEYNIFHPTYFDPYFLPLLRGKPFILTVYDVISEKFNHDSLVDPQVNWKPHIIPKAERIIAISESTKRDIIEYFSIAEDKIDVVYLGGGMGDIIGDYINTPANFILYVGARHAYKNFTAFVQAVAPLLNENLELYCAGGGSFSPNEMSKLRELGIADKVRQSPVSDEQLAYLYRNALVFVFPSLYEGFGIPVVEAMSCECPSIISNTSSFPEVGGDSVSYFDPTSIENMRHSVKQVLDHPTLRDDLRRRGALRSSVFSWEACASNTAKVYAKTLCGT